MRLPWALTHGLAAAGGVITAGPCQHPGGKCVRRSAAIILHQAQVWLAVTLPCPTRPSTANSSKHFCLSECRESRAGQELGAAAPLGLLWAFTLHWAVWGRTRKSYSRAKSPVWCQLGVTAAANSSPRAGQQQWGPLEVWGPPQAQHSADGTQDCRGISIGACPGQRGWKVGTAWSFRSPPIQKPKVFCNSGISKGQVNPAPPTISDRKHHTQEHLPLQQALVAWNRKQQLSLVLRSRKAPYSEKTIQC